MTSIAPLSVAGFIEFQPFETVPVIDRTYCISLRCGLEDAHTDWQQLDGAMSGIRRGAVESLARLQLVVVVVVVGASWRV